MAGYIFPVHHTCTSVPCAVMKLLEYLNNSTIAAVAVAAAAAGWSGGSTNAGSVGPKPEAGLVLPFDMVWSKSSAKKS